MPESPASADAIRAEVFQGRGDAGSVENSYAGIPIFARPGLHAFALERLQPLLASNAEVLELGAGRGAMSLRLAEAGYRVSASDILADNFLAGMLVAASLEYLGAIRIGIGWQVLHATPGWS